MLSPLEALAVVAAGAGAGSVNAVIGSGSLITFPTLVAVGYPAVTANVSNNIGLVPGSVSGAVGYRRELAGKRRMVVRLAAGSLVGAAIGAVLLLVLPESAFEAIVPVLVLLGVALVIVQPWLSRLVAGRGVPRHQAWWVWPLVLLAGVYGGYFGAAQGVLLMGVLGVGVQQSLQESNAVKNVLAAVVNAVAGAIFAVVADVDWLVVALIGVGSLVGGVLGARVGRRLPPTVLRAVIVLVGLVAVAALVLR